jgi:RNA polymerase sigma factor (TIGR02999 family)
MAPLTDITRILAAVEQGNPNAAEELLPLIYGELRKLAAQKMAGEQAGHTLQATALVHEAYLRLVGAENAQTWNGRGHFFAAAAEAMRRILVERARRNMRVRHGGGRKKLNLDDQLDLAGEEPAAKVLALNEALERLTAIEPDAAEIVKLRYFAGLTLEEAAAAVDISLRTANRHWSYARAWLYQQLNEPDEISG